MPIREQTKNYHDFVGGLHTEVTPLTYPDGAVTDIANFRLNIDGSIQRRKGLEAETNAETNDLHAAWDNDNDAVTAHFWRNTGGLDSHIHIIQMGLELYFYDDDATTLVKRTDGIDLRDYTVTGATVTDAELAAEPVDISWGRGQALVTQRYCEPFFLTYDLGSGLVTSEKISIRVRDFVGIEDGTAAVTQPATLTDIHRYNIENAGWDFDEYTAYETANAAYPGRNQAWYKGYKRAETTGTTHDPLGVASFSAARMLAEPMGRSSVHRGKFLQDPFNTTASGGASGPLAISTFDVALGGQQTCTVTTASNHDYAAGDTVNISGQLSRILSYIPLGGMSEFDWSFDGAYEILTENGLDEFTISVYTAYGIASWVDQFKQAGETSVGIENPNGSSTNLRPSTNAYFAARAWYAGTPARELGQRILFSQIIQRNEQYSRCYQANDPTSSFTPDLVESDGGDLYIPEAGRVIKLQPFGPSLLVMCENGIWEIDGGSNRYFDALDYTVRRVSQIGCISRESVVEADQHIIFASEQGAYRIFVDPRYRMIITEPITEEKVNRKWASIPMEQMKAIKTLHDPVEKRIIWLYDTDADATAPTWNYTEALVYDTRLESFYVHTFPEGTDFTTNTWIKTFVRPVDYVRDGQTVIKYLTVNENDEMVFTEMTNTDFEDLGEIDAAAYMVTGHEHMGDPSKDLMVKHVTTFMERVPDSSCKMRGRWDFAESSITGKFAPQQECYRPPRAFLGTSPDTQDDDGYPVVFTKLTLPGQGLVLQLRFDTTAEADCKLYGWSIDFQGLT